MVSAIAKTKVQRPKTLYDMKRKLKTYTISAVAEQYSLHPQTLRMYEREGLLKPSRSEGNTRLYTDPDLARLELILSLTRDLGVNLAGVEIILNMREKMDAMQQEFERFFHYLQSHADELTNFVEPPAEGTTDALVPLTRAAALRRRSTSRSLSQRQYSSQNSCQDLVLSTLLQPCWVNSPMLDSASPWRFPETRSTAYSS